ncbi:hypothetical protein CJ178_30305 [Rhodococcus sp. ACPA4]|uniref:hypothetical protein n=1 Tax=Rhodococcus sp. ACPA4 TaxID=2028571 RepID=UPI000BB0D592|nr:hypothetical protein [Rhodococcus sp. ACPA4]PBC35766.1 hypothetical protein CJ178_30305 [Rhodococcus sp. ACPA4]
MTDDHVDHFFIEGRAVTENPDAVAGALHGGLEAVAGSRAMIVAESGGRAGTQRLGTVPEYATRV